jgi:hypothetical protein
MPAAPIPLTRSGPARVPPPGGPPAPCPPGMVQPDPVPLATQVPGRLAQEYADVPWLRRRAVRNSWTMILRCASG